MISIVHNHTKDGGVPIILQMQEEARLLLLLLDCAASCFVDYSTIVCINCSIQLELVLYNLQPSWSSYGLVPLLTTPCKEVQHASFSKVYTSSRNIVHKSSVSKSNVSQFKTCNSSSRIHSSTNFVKISSCWSSEAATYMTKSYYN